MYKVFIDNISRNLDFTNEEELLSHFSDHRFIEAAGGLVRGEKGFLFIKRHGLWDIPKGKLKKKEFPETGAIREVEEECGVNNPKIVCHLIDTWHTYKTKKKRKVLKKTYWYLMEETELSDLKPQTEEGISEVKFFDPEDFEVIRSNTYGSIIDVLKSLKKYLHG